MLTLLYTDSNHDYCYCFFQMPKFIKMASYSFVLFIWALVVYRTDGGTPCSYVKDCTCSETASFESTVDCRGVDLGINRVCSICTNIENVTVLDVSDTNLTEIPASCFKGCSHLEELYMESNNVYQLNRETFNGLINLKTLSLDGNNLSFRQNISDPEIFKPLIRLEILSLRRNKDTVATANILHSYLENIDKDSLPQLQTLKLDGLLDVTFGSNFQGFTKLRTIDLSGEYSNCNISILTNRTFENLSHLANLNLSFCHISEIEAGTFKPLSNLKYLNLSNNMALGFVTLRNVSYGLQFTQIDVLDYSKVYKTFGMGTELKRCDLWYLKNTSLTELRLNSNRVVMLEVNVMALFPSSLKVLWAENNRLSYGPYAFQLGCLGNLTRIELSMQEIAGNILLYNEELHIQEKYRNHKDFCNIPKNFSKKNCPLLDNKRLHLWDFSSPLSLKTVNCRIMNMGYKLYHEAVTVSIPNIVESLDLSRNVFMHWSSTLIDLDKLQKLNLSGTFCSNISANFFDTAPNIEILDISDNKLGVRLATDNDGLIFKPLTQMRSLYLAINSIVSLPKNIFAYNTRIESLSLAMNNLQKIEFKYEHMTRLISINLSQNKLSTVPLGLFELMTRNALEESQNVSIDLSNNVLDMSSCANVEFLSWMLQHQQYFVNINNYTFRIYSDKTISFKDFANAFDTFEKSCHSYTALIMVTSLCIALFMFIVTSGIIYRYRWRLRYLYYMTKAKYSGYIPISDQEPEKQYKYDAFISYAHDDVLFVKDQLVTKLEDEAGMSLCIHQRDFHLGKYIAENILQAIKNSRMTVVLLSPKFLKSKWCLYEFNMARMESIYSRERENILLVVMLEDVALQEVSPEMRMCLESESFLKFPHDESEARYFWEMLTRTLQDR